MKIHPYPMFILYTLLNAMHSSADMSYSELQFRLLSWKLAKNIRWKAYFKKKLNDIYKLLPPQEGNMVLYTPLFFSPFGYLCIYIYVFSRKTANWEIIISLYWFLSKYKIIFIFPAKLNYINCCELEYKYLLNRSLFIFIKYSCYKLC